MIVGWTLPHVFVGKVSNDCAFSLIAEEAGESIEILEVLSSGDEGSGMHCGLIPQIIEDDCGNLARCDQRSAPPLYMHGEKCCSLCQIGGDDSRQHDPIECAGAADAGDAGGDL